MFAASSRLRCAATLMACALAASAATPIFAQSIDFSLNVIYANPAGANSGGTWELVAKSNAGSFGMSAVTPRISNINNDAIIEGPRAAVNGANAAGFQLLSNTLHPANGQNPAYREYTVAQVPLFPLPAGSEETLFYGVGNIANGAPNYPGKGTATAIGPAFTSLTSPQDIPWATGDVFADSAWATAARMLSGTFATGVTPAFFGGSSGNVFTSLPVTNTARGDETVATAITAIVRTNLLPPVQSADYNHNGIVDAGDYLLWRKTLGSVAVPPGSGADGNADGTVNAADFTLWQSHFGNPMGSGSGANLSSGSVPEPTSCILLGVGVVLGIASRRARYRS